MCVDGAPPSAGVRARGARGLEPQSPSAPPLAFEVELGFPSSTWKLESSGTSMRLSVHLSLWPWGGGRRRDGSTPVTTHLMRRTRSGSRDVLPDGGELAS